MRLLICIPCYDQYELGRISVGQWDWMTTSAAHFLLLDNGSQCDWPKFLATSTLKDRSRWHYVRNDRNVGMVVAAQQAYEYAGAQGYTHLAITHNDVWVFRPEWDQHLGCVYDRVDHLGGVGFFGSKGCGLGGHRLTTFGNVLDAGHGRPITELWEPACVFDGFFQCYSMACLEELGGFDQRYQWMHIYDYDFSLSSIWAGWRNVVLNVPCHHLSGLTANNAAASTSGQNMMDTNIRLFHEKWDSRLGVMVDDNFNYTWHRRP